MPRTVLLIEDNPEDVKLVNDAVARIAPEVRLVVARDGLGALELMRRYASGQQDSLALIILDLHIPNLHGIEVLRQFKSSPFTQFVPVVVFSGTATDVHLRELYTLGISSFVEKLTDHAANRHNLETALQYWLKVNSAATAASSGSDS